MEFDLFYLKKLDAMIKPDFLFLQEIKATTSSILQIYRILFKMEFIIARVIFFLSFCL